jgi:tRNA threonylcarbamoyladenosine biosynthesis protein TsaE
MLHADVYRLDHLQEIVDLGLGELVEDGGVAVVEWGDRAEPVLGTGSLTVHIVASSALQYGSEADPDSPDADDDLRSITLAPIGSAWDSRWKAVTAALAPWAVSR